jgi:hypothetical protein
MRSVLDLRFHHMSYSDGLDVIYRPTFCMSSISIYSVCTEAVMYVNEAVCKSIPLSTQIL